MRKKMLKNEKGQGLVEFALVLPILLLILVAVVDFGWYIFIKTNLNNAAREGARVYAVTQDEGKAIEAAQSYMSYVDGGSSDVSIATSGSGSTAYATCDVTAQVQPLVGFVFSGPMNIGSSARMRLEFTYK